MASLKLLIEIDENGYLRVIPEVGFDALEASGSNQENLSAAMSPLPPGQRPPHPRGIPTPPVKTEAELIRETVMGSLGMSAWNPADDSVIDFVMKLSPDLTHHHFKAAIAATMPEIRQKPIAMWLPMAMTMIVNQQKEAAAAPVDPTACPICGLTQGAHYPNCPSKRTIAENPGGAIPTRGQPNAGLKPDSTGTEPLQPRPTAESLIPQFTVCNDPNCPIQRYHRVVNTSAGRQFVHFAEDLQNLAQARNDALMKQIAESSSVNTGLELPQPPRPGQIVPRGVPPPQRPPQTEEAQPRPGPSPDPGQVPIKRGRGRPKKAPQTEQ